MFYQVCFITVCIKSTCLIFNWIKLYTTSHTSEYRLTHEVGDHISRDRIITLTDAVLAIVMTLLVFEIAVPQLSRSELANELPKRLLELWPVVWSYATSFIILGFFGLPMMISFTTSSVPIEHFSDAGK
jgi:Endosomal/lysosomal potassium channel TMEM175